MTSSTERSSGRQRLIALAVTVATCIVAWVVISSALEVVARQVERRTDASLWRFEEWMQLLSPVRYEARGDRRVMVIGPSESREAFWPEPFRQLLGARLVNDSLSLSTFEDAVTQLEYIERVYGRGAIGDVLIVAVTPRLMANYAPGERPLEIVLNRYSPRFSLNQDVEPEALVAKGPFAGLLARVRILAHSGARYQRTLRAVQLALRARLRGENLAALFRGYGLVASRFFDTKPFDKNQYYRWVQTGADILPSMAYFFKLRSMDPRTQREPILRDFKRLRAIAARNGTRILVVNLPEGGWARRFFYNPGIHEAYDAVVHEAVGELPFLDLREILPDDGFVDWMHPTRAASLEISRRVAGEIRRLGLQ